jgi:hypothetical protein
MQTVEPLIKYYVLSNIQGTGLNFHYGNITRKKEMHVISFI